jgi:hypothetical protein
MVEAPEDELEPAPEPIAELAASCSSYVRRAVGFDLDGTPETLPLLDHYLGTVRATLDGRPELADLLVRATGAYFGEVARGRMNGFWLVPSGNVHDWRVCGRTAYLHLNPIGVAYDALFASTEHGGPRATLHLLPEDRDVVERRLSALPEVDEAEYHALSTRFEVIEIVLAIVRELSAGRGYADTEYDERDYQFGWTPVGG